MLEVFGTGKVRPERLDEVLDAIREFVPFTRQEDGTQAYVVYQHSKDPCRILFHETYRDLEAQEAHLSTPELKALTDLLFPSLEGDVVMGVFNEIASK